MNRSSLIVIHPSLDPVQAQREFIRTEIFQRRKELEIVYSEFWSLVQQICFATSPERPITDFINEIPDAHSVDPSIRSRDNYRCKCTGYLTAFWSDERKTLVEPTLPNERYAAPLEIVHRISYELGDRGYALLSRLLGILLMAGMRNPLAMLSCYTRPSLVPFVCPKSTSKKRMARWLYAFECSQSVRTQQRASTASRHSYMI